MQTSLTLAGAAALFASMVVLAAIPSVSVFAVIARSTAFGANHGILTALGIAIGDVVFILLAALGLSLLAENLEGLFVVIKYVGGSYLIWLGFSLCRAKSQDWTPRGEMDASNMASFLTGLLITLGDSKAILFYLGFLPAFFDLSSTTTADTSLLVAIAVLAVGGVKVAYAILADKARLMVGSASMNTVNRIAGSVMIVIGIAVVLRA